MTSDHFDIPSAEVRTYKLLLGHQLYNTGNISYPEPQHLSYYLQSLGRYQDAVFPFVYSYAVEQVNSNHTSSWRKTQEVTF